MSEKGGWTPQLSADGQFYCSPRCGSGRYCRKEWFDRATAQAAALAARMGEDWEPRVWENLGWHYTVRKPFGGPDSYAEIREHGFAVGAPSYTAEIKPGPSAGAVGMKRPGMKCTLQFFADAADPHTALAQAKERMEAEAATLAASFEAARAAL